MNLENLETQFAERLGKHLEWLLILPHGKSFALQTGEIEIFVEREKLFFVFLSDEGFQTWRVADFDFETEKIRLNLTKNFGTEKILVELVPRASAKEFSGAVELARIARADKIARLLLENFPPSKLVRVALNRETGRFAQIVFETRGAQKAALADVTETLTPEQLLAQAILWTQKLRNRRKNSIESVSILAEKKSVFQLQKLRALLRKNWRERIEIFELSGEAEKAGGENLKRIANLQISDLWTGKAKKVQPFKTAESSAAAERIIALAPLAIDAIFTKHGETLRFRGLPFARVRRIFGEEKTWFGTGARRQILCEKNFAEFLELIENLKTYRRFDSMNKQHAFYRDAPESWLEAILRRDIKKLDANLILSPIHNQFRTGRDRIDLLALRRDGRVIVIELKVAPDRAGVFQAADYWQKIEQMRRSGSLQRACVFGDLEIMDAPPLVFIVAPMLSVHRDFEFLSKTIAPEIEIYRYDLNENWRENLQVLRRKSLADD